jgi:hypothetical protein
MKNDKRVNLGFSLAWAGSMAVLLLLGAVPAWTQSANQACVYQDGEYKGLSLCLAVGEEDADLTLRTWTTNLSSGNWNDRISSVKVGFNTKIVLWTDINFGGDRVILQYDSCNNTSPRWSNMPKGWNDRVSSFKVMSCDNIVSDPGVGANQVIFYEHRDYGGMTLPYNGTADVRDLTQVTTNLSPANWNDRISAIAIGSSMKVIFYKDINCPQPPGENGILTVSSPCLVSSGWNDKISSFKILFK